MATPNKIALILGLVETAIAKVAAVRAQILFIFFNAKIAWVLAPVNNVGAPRVEVLAIGERTILVGAAIKSVVTRVAVVAKILTVTLKILP